VRLREEDETYLGARLEGDALAPVGVEFVGVESGDDACERPKSAAT
jgi:hypothetical protein